MIHVQRSTYVRMTLQSERAVAAKKAAAAFYDLPGSERSQERHSFREELWTSVVQNLRWLIGGKCALLVAADGCAFIRGVRWSPKRHMRGSSGS
jgi:hypothetical protein